MLIPELKLNSRIALNISTLERMVGRWDILKSSFPNSVLESTIEQNHVDLIECLQKFEPSRSSFDVNLISEINPCTLSQAFIAAPDKESISALYSNIFSVQKHNVWRQEAADFVAPMGSGFDQDIVFHVLSPFLTESRFSELCLSVRRELDSNVSYPLINIGLFHLLFLQIHPFRFGNHFFSLLLLQSMLRNYGYEFVSFQSPVIFFLKNTRSYFSALKLAEKTSLGSWNSLNAWLDFLLYAMSCTISELLDVFEQKKTELFLTPTRKDIIALIRNTGPLSRDDVSHHMGMNLHTAKYHLLALAKDGILKRIGAGRTSRYVTSKDCFSTHPIKNR